MSDDPQAPYAAALASLPLMTVRRLAALIGAGAPEAVWHTAAGGGARTLAGVAAVLGAAAPDVSTRWSTAAGRYDVAASWARLRDAGRSALWLGGPGYPPRLDADPEPPPVLFVEGALDHIARPSTALVGTRAATGYGRDVARLLGRQLAEAGVVVVSGLALGIDGAAHEGALAAMGAPPVAVVGSGLDVVYPRRHARLWQRVAGAGAILTEAPPGSAPEPWRFPLRNRIIAGLSDVVVVVESRATGGSMHTVDHAHVRSRPVLAVPGSIMSGQSAGTNQLLAEGATPVRDVDDILVALSLAGCRAPVGRSAHCAVESGPGPEPQAPLDATAQLVLDAVDWTPTRTDEILRRTGMSLSVAAVALTRLEVLGRVRGGGGWWERSGHADRCG